MKIPVSPFPTTGYYGPEYFCDRHKELKGMINNTKGGQATTLVALRRLGKTALIKHFFHHVHTEYCTIYIDLLPTESLNDMLNTLSTALTGSVPEKSKFGKKLWSWLKSIRPVITYDPISGQPQVSIQAGPDESRNSIQQLVGMLEEHNQTVIVAIDEFQQILNYPEKNMDGWFRTITQDLRNTIFIYSGSQQHLMTGLFLSPERPFFRSTQFMRLGKIPKQQYQAFIIRKFEEKGKTIQPALVDELLSWTESHTYYVQLICNRLFLSSGKKVDLDVYHGERLKLLKENEFVFFSYRDMLTRSQWALLKAVSREHQLYQPTSSGFTTKYHLGNPASVLRSLQSLQKMDLVYKDMDEKGEAYYSVYDILFKNWIRP